MRYRLFAILLLPFALGGCPSTQTTAQSTPDGVPALTLLHSGVRPLGGVDFLEFSKDGETISVAGEFHSVRLYSAYDYALLDEPLKKATNPEGITRIISVRGVGYIDANTWYYAIRESPDIVAHIRSIHPAREISRHPLKVGYSRLQIVANENFIASDETLLNWHSGERYPVRTAHPMAPGFTLTRSGRVLTHGWNYGGGDVIILLDDPAKGTIDYWDAESTVESIVII